MGVLYKNYFKINLTFLYIILYFCIFLYIIWNGYEFEMFAHDFFSLGLNKWKNNRKLLYFICLIYATYMQHKNDILKAVTGIPYFPKHNSYKKWDYFFNSIF